MKTTKRETCPRCGGQMWLHALSETRGTAGQMYSATDVGGGDWLVSEPGDPIAKKITGKWWACQLCPAPTYVIENTGSRYVEGR